MFVVYDFFIDLLFCQVFADDFYHFNYEALFSTL